MSRFRRMRPQPGGRPAATRRTDRAILAEAEQLLALARRLRRDLLRNPGEDAEGFGLTGPQVSAMACLVGRGPTTLTELSRALGMSHSTASGIVDRLQSRGLVRRTKDTSDKRRTTIMVTEKVARYVREIQEGPAGRLARALGGATAAERAAIRKGLTLLCGLLRQQARRPAPPAGSTRSHSPRVGSPRRADRGSTSRWPPGIMRRCRPSYGRLLPADVRVPVSRRGGRPSWRWKHAKGRIPSCGSPGGGPDVGWSACRGR